MSFPHVPNSILVKNLDIFITYEDSDKIILAQRDLTLPYVDDGLFEVVGFRDAWHGLVLLAPNGHGTRLAQVRTRWFYNYTSSYYCFFFFLDIYI